MVGTRTVGKGMLVLLGLLIVRQVLGVTVLAQSTAAAAQLTILVRDADGTPLPRVWLTLHVRQPPADPRRIAERATDNTGYVVVAGLDPEATYTLHFQGAVPILINGERADSKPVQSEDDQNAGRELRSPDDVPGFPIALGGQRAATIRFVIGGTYSSGPTVAAVPMFDLAERDDAPVRPVNPLTGDELTPEQARTFHAVIGEPWGVARGGEVSPEALTSGAAPGPVASVEAVPLPSSAAGGTGSSSPAAPGESSPLTLVLVATTVLLAVVIGVLLRGRRRPG